MKRILSIDFTRGLVMILMVLDHVRDFMHIDSVLYNPTDLSTTTTGIFLTRIITYICAPVFVFLAGSSAYLSLQNAPDKKKASKFLFKRGLWLIFLEFTVVNFGIWFDLGFHLYLFQVIAAIGLGFIALSLLSRRSAKTIGGTGLLIILTHNLASLIPFPESSTLKDVLTPLFSTTAIPLSTQTALVIGYPPLPWIGILLAGFGLGVLFNKPQDERKSIFLKIGLISIALFLVLRSINEYGDPAPWTVQKSDIFTVLSFINVTKYPPSLIYCCATLGSMFIILSLAERFESTLTQFISTYGKTPMFFYLMHWYIVHPLLFVILFIQGFSWHEMDFASGTFGRPKGVASGIELWTVYLIWITVVLLLYYPCKKFGEYKARHKSLWVRYI
jgi:Predicted membrane protein